MSNIPTQSVPKISTIFSGSIVCTKGRNASAVELLGKIVGGNKTISGVLKK